MASDIAIRKPDAGHSAPGVDNGQGAPMADAGEESVRAPVRAIAVSRLTRLIVLANLAALAVLVVGMLTLTEMRRSLIVAKIDSLRTQAEFVSGVLADAATVGAPRARVMPDPARAVLRRLYIPEGARARLYDDAGVLIADSYLLSDQTVVRELPPPGAAAPAQPGDDAFGAQLRRTVVATALLGETVSGERVDERGERLAYVAVPLQRVSAVLGVVVLEDGGIEALLAKERRSLAPFVLIAVVMTIGTSVLLTLVIARPIRRLAEAADSVRQEGPRRAAIPDLSSRRDEIGDLSASLAAMTRALADRIDAIERFAADVAHEIKNPLTSIRSAVETFPAAKTDEQRDRLLGLVRHDVTRIDRLITDISNASRMDAELARAQAAPLNLAQFLEQVVDLYALSPDETAPRVTLKVEPAARRLRAVALDGPLGQVFRNLIDNARTFSPPDGEVRVTLSPHDDAEAGRYLLVTVDDDGPGVPPDNLEKVFDRFYTERPKGAAFGSHSGLGLAIARQIVEAHSGRVWAENRHTPTGVVGGARFSVLLPALPA